VPVIVQEHRGSDVVALQLWVRAGARDEATGEAGLAHYLAHMLFKGTTVRPGGFIEREVEGVGGRMNAGTSWDYTFYHAVLPASRARAGIEMLADIAVNATLDATVLDAEKRVVLQEIRRSEDTPRGVLVRRLYGLVFDGHPYGRPVLGTPEVIRGLTRETLRGFYRRHYVPESFALVVVGAVDPREALAAAREAFERLPRSGLKRLPVAAPQATPPHRDELPRPGSLAWLGLAWPAPKIDHGDTPAMDLLVSVLGRARSSRLVQALRERRGLVSSISASFSALEGAGIVMVTAQLAPGDLARAEAAIVGEVERLREAGVTEAERRRAVTAAEAAHEFSVETAEGRALALGRAETVWSLDEELTYQNRLRAISTEQLRFTARRYLDPARYARLAVVPQGRP